MCQVDAYHEAGHAFMATYLGGRVRSVTITPDNDDGPDRFGDAQVSSEAVCSECVGRARVHQEYAITTPLQRDATTTILLL